MTTPIGDPRTRCLPCIGGMHADCWRGLCRCPLPDCHGSEASSSPGETAEGTSHGRGCEPYPCAVCDAVPFLALPFGGQAVDFQTWESELEEAR